MLSQPETKLNLTRRTPDGCWRPCRPVTKQRLLDAVGGEIPGFYRIEHFSTAVRILGSTIDRMEAKISHS